MIKVTDTIRSAKEMKTGTKRIIFAFAVAPLAVILLNTGFSIYFLIESLFEPPPSPNTLVWPDPRKPWEFVFLFSLYGVPTAYLTLPIIWYPIYGLIRKMKKVNGISVILLAGVCSIPAILFLGRPYSLGSFGSLAVFLVPHGIAVSFAFLWLSGRKLTNQAELGGAGNA